VTAGQPATIVEAFAQRGIAVGRHYPVLGPDQPAVRDVGTTIGSLPVARRLAEREISLPIHPYLEDEEIEMVIHCCLEVCG
jgi:dTDP-4-amino-4,6-dideoxygalactose transaminase